MTLHTRLTCLTLERKRFECGHEFFNMRHSWETSLRTWYEAQDKDTHLIEPALQEQVTYT